MPERQQQILEAAVRVIARNGVRGLRVEKISAEAGISTALIYYHFGNRAGLLRHTLEFINDRAAVYTQQVSAETPRAELELLLSRELQDSETVRENSTAWGELRASAVFDAALREPLAESTRIWVGEVAEVIERTKAKVDAVAVAERLTTLVEGLSERWLSGSMTLDRAQELLKGAIAREIG
ncbi:TetR/AcrR family transcriptional regulator [Kibdelosporangium philippinense]|uniref:TetR/AcrR family transcriptional regulator n=1 Tax=Kibdelosporangium philippinense TaxID=211113 RepID=A0ABS8ZA45_9PSEU|nr:TetR/AcrR family transcriptional regulator [Kibdelosporangium philippinense]MCE7004739.1 TetR/AcrR family transcriptional regulator [Kibdelosporangium philippinense]